MIKNGTNEEALNTIFDTQSSRVAGSKDISYNGKNYSQFGLKGLFSDLAEELHPGYNDRRKQRNEQQRELEKQKEEKRRLEELERQKEELKKQEEFLKKQELEQEQRNKKKQEVESLLTELKVDKNKKYPDYNSNEYSYDQIVEMFLSGEYKNKKIINGIIFKRLNTKEFHESAPKEGKGSFGDIANMATKLEKELFKN